MQKDSIFFSKSFVVALVLHIVFFTLLLSSISFTHHKPPLVDLQVSNTKPEIVKATMVDKSAVDAAIKRQADADDKRKKQQKAAAEQLALQQRKAEELKKEAEQAKQSLALAQEKKSKLETDAKKVAEDKAKLLQEQQKIKQQITAAKKEEEKRELARKQQAEAQAQQEAARKAQLEQQKRQQFVNNEVDRYRAEFQSVIEENRILSGVFNGNIICTLRIKLLPDGSIASVSIVETSGNPAYDEMSAAAVYKSAPFPMPQDTELYNKLRDIVLSFRNGDLDVS